MGLPPLSDGWIRALLGASPPEETQATCHDCVMCKRPGEPSQSPTFYDPRIKCCTYFPRLPNFLVGAILDETDPGMAQGVRALSARIEAGVEVTPLGVNPPPVQDLLYGIAGQSGFGRTLAMRCPYYIEASGGCGVWRHRNGVCATYFCKYDRGAVGRRFWTALDRLLRTVEEALAIHCALELGIGDEATRRLALRVSPEKGRSPQLDSRQLDGQRPADYDAMWGEWRGREAQFYSACARIVEVMAWSDVLAAAGTRGRLDAAEVANAHRALSSQEIPPALRAGSFTARPAAPGSVCLKGYSAGDELAAPNLVLEVLAYFDGRPLDEVLRQVEEETGVTLEPAFLRKLLDFEILVA